MQTKDTILIVEDDEGMTPLVHILVDMSLKGSVVLMTDRSQEALRIIGNEHDRLLLVITDGHLLDEREFPQGGENVAIIAAQSTPYVIFHAGQAPRLPLPDKVIQILKGSTIEGGLKGVLEKIRMEIASAVKGGNNIVAA